MIEIHQKFQVVLFSKELLLNLAVMRKTPSGYCTIFSYKKIKRKFRSLAFFCCPLTGSIFTPERLPSESSSCWGRLQRQKRFGWEKQECEDGLVGVHKTMKMHFYDSTRILIKNSEFLLRNTRNKILKTPTVYGEKQCLDTQQRNVSYGRQFEAFHFYALKFFNVIAFCFLHQDTKLHSTVLQ